MIRKPYLYLATLLLALLLAGAVRAYAESELTLGLVAAPTGLVRDEAQGQAFAANLAARLNVPVRLRMFADESQMYNWLSRFREIDCTWLSAEFTRKLPAGEVLPLVAVQSFTGSATPGYFVARQGYDAVALQRLRKALLDAAPTWVESALAPAAAVKNITPAVADEAPPPQITVRPASRAAVPAPAAPAPAVPAVPRDEPPVTLAADQLDYLRDSREFRASGAARLERGTTALDADELRWQDATRDAAARGNVRLVESGGELSGSSLQVNTASGRGLISDGRVLLKENNFHLTGTELERLDQNSYQITDGSFTTCDGDPPDWQFTASDVDVDMGSYATARNVWFEVHDLPLLYLPYLVFPVKSERESGFLLPRAGYSSRKGALLSLAWYEVIDRNLDATLYLDYLSRIGVGKGLEYRYDLGVPGRGRAYAYHVSGIEDTPDSYALDWQHEGMLPGGVRLAADVEYVDRREYFEDFGETADEYNRDQAVSTLLAQRNWGKLNLTGYARYIKDLENDNDATLQRLPEIGVDVPFFRLGDEPVYSRTEMRATNFWREDDSAGDDGQRLFLRQGLSLVLKPGSWLEITPEVAAYARYYHADSGEETDFIPEFAATLSTRLQRVYPFNRWGVDAIQHSIEPQVTYTYIPNEDQDDLPLFDIRDRIMPLNQVGYALVNRLTARFVDADGRRSYREVLNLRLSQIYDIREERDDSLADPEPFSDLRVELKMHPGSGLTLDADALIKVHDQVAFNRLTASVGYSDGRGNGANLGYVYRSDESGVDPTDYLGVSLDTALLAPLYARVEERYDFNGGGSLETVLGLEYRARCWSLFLTYRDREGEEEVLFGVSLAGLGRVGGFGSSLRTGEN